MSAVRLEETHGARAPRPHRGIGEHLGGHERALGDLQSRVRVLVVAYYVGVACAEGAEQLLGARDRPRSGAEARERVATAGESRQKWQCEYDERSSPARAGEA